MEVFLFYCTCLLKQPLNSQKIRRRKTAAWLREQVLQLGPTFIKLGQLSSTRSDLFPKEFVDELAKLQVFILCVDNFGEGFTLYLLSSIKLGLFLSHITELGLFLFYGCVIWVAFFLYCY
jgi:hypothetical protein